MPFDVSAGSMIEKVREWRVGHWDESNIDDFEGDIYNIKVWHRSLDASEVEQEYQSLGLRIISHVLEKRKAPAAGYDASKATSETQWSDSFGTNEMNVKGLSTPRLVKDGVRSRYVFAGGKSSTFFESSQKSGISGGDTAISTCAVYTDKGRKGEYTTVLSSWAGVENEHEMAWISRLGRPATDDWKQGPRGRKGRVSLSTTKDDIPSHVCWTTSKWSMQAMEAVTKIYINGVLAATQEANSDSSNAPVRALEGVWRLGHWDGISDDMQFEGDIYNVKVWHRSLSAAEVMSEYTSVYQPILSAWVAALAAPVAIYEASKGASSGVWADSSSNHNDLVLKGGSGPTFHDMFGIGSHFSFVKGQVHGFWESTKKTGISGRDTAVSVCAVYKDLKLLYFPRSADRRTLFSSWTGSGVGQDMVWFSKQGRPGSDNSASAGRLSKNATEEKFPAHVCWTTSKWELQDRTSVTKIYIDGVEAGTEQLQVTPETSRSLEGVWRIGHWGTSASNDDFEGDIWNIKVWQRCLAAVEVKQEYITVGKPIQRYQASLRVYQQGSALSKSTMPHGPSV
jgi:hypothetical protein